MRSLVQEILRVPVILEQIDGQWVATSLHERNPDHTLLTDLLPFPKRIPVIVFASNESIDDFLASSEPAFELLQRFIRLVQPYRGQFYVRPIDEWISEVLWHYPLFDFSTGATLLETSQNLFDGPLGAPSWAVRPALLCSHDYPSVLPDRLFSNDVRLYRFLEHLNFLSWIDDAKKMAKVGTLASTICRYKTTDTNPRLLDPVGVRDFEEILVRQAGTNDDLRLIFLTGDHMNPAMGSILDVTDFGWPPVGLLEVFDVSEPLAVGPDWSNDRPRPLLGSSRRVPLDVLSALKPAP